jgi:hypothetical protein
VEISGWSVCPPAAASHCCPHPFLEILSDFGEVVVSDIQMVAYPVGHLYRYTLSWVSRIYHVALASKPAMVWGAER